MVNLLRYLIDVIRLIMLKNSGFMNLLPLFFAIVVMAAVFNFWAVFNYRKTASKNKIFSQKKVCKSRLFSFNKGINVNLPLHIQ